MNTSPQGKQKLKGLEGFRGVAYQDIVGVWTLGYGFTHGINPGDVISVAEADARLDAELIPYEDAVSSVGPATQNQFDAMVLLAWNIGITAFLNSSVAKAHRKADYQSAARAFGLWVKAGGKVINGLVRRRAEEAALYMTPEPHAGIEEMPQAVDAPKPLTSSSIITAGTATAAVSALSVMSQAAQQIREIKDSLGDMLPAVIMITAVAGVFFGAWVIWERVKQRRDGAA